MPYSFFFGKTTMSYKVKVSHVALWIAVAMAVGIVLGILLSPSTRNASRIISPRTSGTSKIDHVLQLINGKYVDPVDYDSLVDNTIMAMLEKLDPHSVYIPASDFEKEQESMQGNFEGIGIMYRMDEDTVCVIQAIEGGPSKKAGIMAGDKIITVNDSIIAGKGLSTEQIMSKLKGKKGTRVRVGIKRSGVPKLLKFGVTRDVIPTYSVVYHGMLDKRTGYIRLTKFSATSYAEFVLALSELKDEGMKNLILDLRDNSGGLLDQAIGIADELLPGREMIVYTQDRNGRKSKSYSHKGGIFSEGNLLVMIDEFSASASEIVAGAVQDNDRGIIVGRRSFGKGLVQEQIELPDQSALRLTVARYYTPSGRCIQRPYEKGSDEYYADFLLRLTAELSDSINYVSKQDTVKYYTTSGRVVYGGGGILPDVIYHLPKDTTYRCYNTLVDKGLVQKYAFDYNDRNRKFLLRKYPTADDFVNDFTVDGEMLDVFLQYANNQGVVCSRKALKGHDKELSVLLKANIAELLFNEEAFYKVYLGMDTEVVRSLKLINRKAD